MLELSLEYDVIITQLTKMSYNLIQDNLQHTTLTLINCAGIGYNIM